MSPVVCSFCSHANPAGSAFCNECGAALTLTLCEACEAVNDRSATHCHTCGSDLSGASSIGAPVGDASFPPPNDLAPHTIALAATRATVDELEPHDSNPSLGWPRRRLSPAFVLLPLCALGAVSYYAYYRWEADHPTPAAPATGQIHLQSSPGTARPQRPRDELQQLPAAESPAGAGTPAQGTDRTSPGGKEPPPAIDAGSNDRLQQAPPQSAPKDASTAQPAESTAQAPQAENSRRQKPRSLKRDNSSAPSKPRLPGLMAPGSAPAPDSREEARFRPPAKCTDAVAALALCSRSNPNQGQ